MKKKLLAFSAIRSDYDLLSQVYKLLNKDKGIQLKIIVSGAHLSRKYGYTVTDIEKDKLDILAKIKTLSNFDDKTTRLKSASILFQKSIDIVKNYNPDLIIYAGDREEVMVASIIAGYLEIPTLHFFGGDHVKDSHIDNPIRHATSKLSSAHIVSHREHYQRLLEMGEEKKRIFNIGSVALDKFTNETIISKKKIKKYFGIKNGFNRFALLIFHPIPEERQELENIFENILLTLKQKNINTFVSYPNIDYKNSKIINLIKKYKYDKNFYFYKSLERKIFLSIYKNAEFIIGNSSSGILESASIPIPAINVGFRQKGRRANNNVLFVDKQKSNIKKGIEKIFSKKFQNKYKSAKNTYGDGKSSLKAYKLIKNINFRKLVYKNEDILKIKK